MAMAEVESPLIDDNGEVLRLKNGMISSLAEFQPQLLDLLYDIQNEKLSDDLQKMEKTTGINREQVDGFVLQCSLFKLDAILNHSSIQGRIIPNSRKFCEDIALLPGSANKYHLKCSSQVKIKFTTQLMPRALF
ncbi:hypothetical protein Tcan_12348 [Toxocara canis]|uniref:Uncharacterized protein n=1 Tax=Toxocara canis TaxID=6265 RepID=A0A0B2W3E4_TOXCA|nr:hypothetical protein Tcan_12348 [Toxocara canis]